MNQRVRLTGFFFSRTLMHLHESVPDAQRVRVGPVIGFDDTLL